MGNISGSEQKRAVIYPLAAGFVVPALGLICLFFAMDTAGSVAMFGPTSSNVGYWAHTGGYLFGFALAFIGVSAPFL